VDDTAEHPSPADAVATDAVATDEAASATLWHASVAPDPSPFQSDIRL